MTLDLLAQQAVIGAVGGEQQTVDWQVSSQRMNWHSFSGLLRVIHSTEAVAAGRSGLFGSVGQFGKEGVGNIGKHRGQAFRCRLC